MSITTIHVPLIYLVRHGVTHANKAGRYEGRGDSDLTSEGVRQAHSVAEMLVGKRIAAVYSSPRRRALRTAEIISRELGLTPIPVVGLAEADFGEWDGLTFEEISRRYPAEVERWITDPLGARPPGGESLLEMWRRVRACFVGQGHGDTGLSIAVPEGSSVVVVSHGGPIRAILSFVQCGDLSAFQHITIRPGEVRSIPADALRACGISDPSGQP